MNRNCLLICVLGLVFFTSTGRAADPTKPPNFVVILTDDQSWVGSSLLMDPDDRQTRSNFYRTPNIERLAERGMLFTQGYAPAPFCCPTRRSLLVGQTPARHVYQKDQPGWTKTRLSTGHCHRQFGTLRLARKTFAS